MKKMTLLLVAVSASLLAVAWGCTNDGNNDNDQADAQYSDLEQSFLATVNDMHTAVTQFADATDQAAARSDYYDQVDLDISDLNDLWSQMRSQCTEFAEDCPVDGGATGAASDQCMSGGHMMNQQRMGQLQGMIEACRSDLTDFWDICGTQWNETCPAIAAQHAQDMRAVLDQVRDDCHTWWSENTNANGEHNHWGDCSMEHHQHHD